MEERINVNIKLLPEGSYVFKETLEPKEEKMLKDSVKGPVYHFPANTSFTRIITIYGLPVVSLR